MNSSPVSPSLAHSMSIGVWRPRLSLIMIFDQAGPAGKRQDLVVGDRKPRAVLGGNGTFLIILPPPTS